MNGQNFATTLSVEASAKEVFDAINNVRGWWGEDIDGPTGRLGEEFTYRFEDQHVCRIRVVELVPGRKVSWLVVDNYFDFTQDKTEWRDTAISFEIAENDGRTEIRFAHLGLVPEYECFAVCSNAWGFYINGSLRSLIATGEGKPNAKGRARTPVEQLLSSGATRRD